MTAADAILAAVMPGLLVASAFFSGSETALFGLTADERGRLRAGRPAAARAVARLLASPRMLLITILLGNMVVNVVYFVIASVLALRAESVAMRAVWSVAPLLMIILLGEVTPKLLAAADRVRWCALFAPALHAAHRAIAPVRVVVNAAVIEPGSRLTGGARPPALAPEELAELLEHSAREGEIDPVEAEILDDVVELGALRVRDIMTPRVDLRWVDEGADAQAVRAAIRQAGVSRLPVCPGSIDRGVVGVIDSALALPRLAADPGRRAADVMGPALFVPEQARLDQLLERLREGDRLMAIAVDEHGAVAGVVTFHDVAARIGRLLERDESGLTDAGPPEIERLGPDVWRVPGRLSVRDLLDAFDPASPRGPGAVAGLVHSLLGRIARPGDRVRFGPIELEVERMRGRAVESVIVRLIETRRGAVS
ncbi:MAG: HlyC/CorC family transporter [Planctomycetota bacterium]|nr:MAG: HlyC/CorC family transporter [Planctomycetota bacterium]